jgi:hypothetical protein
VHALGAGHAVEVPQVLHVRHRDAGHDADLGARDLGQPLEDQPPRILLRVEQRQRESQLVVEGTLARGCAERRGQAAGQEVLGGGLAHRPGDADGAADPTAGERREAQQRGGGVAHTDRRPAHRLLRGEVGRRARLERCRDEGVAVALGHDGSVELPGPDRPRVDARPFDADLGPDQLTAQMGRQLSCRAAHG